MTPPLEKWLAEVERKNESIKFGNEALLVKLLRKVLSELDDSNDALSQEICGDPIEAGKILKSWRTSIEKELTQIISDILGATNG